MRPISEPPILIVAGPTASGKSALALALAEEFHGTIINADSMQVYRDLSVVTARPGSAELARVPHRLYGVIDAAEACSVGRWRGMAAEEINVVRATGRVPIFAGGTGLYLRALTEGLAAVPTVPLAVRQEARALHTRLGGAAFRAALAQLDPEGAQRLRVEDTQRLLRAYEVVTATGRSLGAWQAVQEVPSLRAAAIVLLPPRPALYAACDARLVAMMERGAVAEVKALLARDLDPMLPAMKAVGVPELAAYVAGRATRDGAIAAAQQATRRYAKRQYTWLRRQMPESERLQKMVIETQYSESFLAEIFSFIRRFVLTGHN